jgi:hypothetical protein
MNSVTKLLTLLAMLSDPQEDIGPGAMGPREWLTALRGASHMIVCSPDDCPSCYEFLIAEATRLANDRAWRGRWALAVLTQSATDTSFTQWLRDRYAPPMNLLTMERSKLSALLPGGVTGTPCIVVRNPDSTWTKPRIMSPSALGAAAEFFDSLYVSGPGDP